MSPRVYFVIQALLPTWLLSCFSATWGLEVKVQQGKRSLVPRPLPDIVLIPGLLLIFLHSCEIKFGRGLGTRLG